MAWIGPTGCDENRARRVRTIDAIWKELRIDTKRHIILGDSFDLLREGLSCYQNGAFMATAALCRASTESAVYLAVTRHPKYDRQWGIIRTRINLDYVDEKWGRIIELASRTGIVSVRCRRTIEVIRDAGNYVLHNSQRGDRATIQLATNPTSQRSIGTRYNEDGTSKILRQTISVLNKIGDWFERWPS